MKFKVGEIYKDREGREYRFLMYAPEAKARSQLIFMCLKTEIIQVRFLSGSFSDSGRESVYDIIPHEKKTVKLYSALFHNTFGGYSFSDKLYDTKPATAIRLVTEWAPVVVEVEE